MKTPTEFVRDFNATYELHKEIDTNVTIKKYDSEYCLSYLEQNYKYISSKNINISFEKSVYDYILNIIKYNHQIINIFEIYCEETPYIKGTCPCSITMHIVYSI